MKEENVKLTSRLADISDTEIIKKMMAYSIKELLKPYLSRTQIKASYESMGFDKQLIHDKTYFILNMKDIVVGCGGWSKRKTLFGGNHTKNRDDTCLDPEHDAARIRAMYTHPEWTRRGVGKMIIELSERGASSEGFKKIELMATLAGEPLYKSCGYTVVEETEFLSSKGIKVPLKKMVKDIS